MRVMERFIFLISIARIVLFSADVQAVVNPFKIQVFDGATELGQPYTLVSGKQYRLQAVSANKKVLPAQWFLSGNLGSITTDIFPMLIAVFVGEGSLICRVEGVEQRVALSVVPKTKTIGDSGGELQSPAGVSIELPKGALVMDRKIGIEIVAPPGLPPPRQQLVQVIRLSPERLVLKRPGQLTFLYGSTADVSRNPLNPPYQGDTIGKSRLSRNPLNPPYQGDAVGKPQLYFWETFGRKWVPLQGRDNTIQGGVTTSINHFGIYALMAAIPEDVKRSNRLQIQNVTLSPRVFFAPDRNRLTIAYQLNAPDATQAFVTMDIFDLRGRWVRRLLEETPRYIGANAAQWDGLTDDGTLARNGRYLLVLRARKGSQQAVYRKLIIVFK